MTSETWKDIPGYDGNYQISDKGRVRSTDRFTLTKTGQERRYKGKILKTFNSHGYEKLQLSLDGTKQDHYVHRLVLECFVGDPLPDQCANHKDGNKKNNVPGNLEWVSHGENLKHSYDTGLRHANKFFGIRNGNSKLNEIDVLVILVKRHIRDLTHDQISEKVGVSKSTVANVLNGKSWVKTVQKYEEIYGDLLHKTNHN